jgi:hypothetical protein
MSFEKMQCCKVVGGYDEDKPVRCSELALNWYYQSGARSRVCGFCDQNDYVCGPSTEDEEEAEDSPDFYAGLLKDELRQDGQHPFKKEKE